MLILHLLSRFPGAGHGRHMSSFQLSADDLTALNSGGSAAVEVLRSVCLSSMQKWRPPEWSDVTIPWEVERHAFQLAAVLARTGPKGTLCDVGGGWGHFAATAATIGMKTVCIDCMPITEQDPRVGMSRDYGFELRIQDVVDSSLDFQDETLDAFVSFDCIEHLHHSPKQFYRQAVRALRPGGVFFLGAPNCVNMRKRLGVPLGKGSWSTMQRWYEQPRFYDHVREPDVGDLLYIARDLGLTDVQTFGRNWQGYYSTPLMRSVTRIVDLPLRLFPSLCSDIYMIGTKPR